MSLPPRVKSQREMPKVLAYRSPYGKDGSDASTSYAVSMITVTGWKLSEDLKKICVKIQKDVINSTLMEDVTYFLPV